MPNNTDNSAKALQELVRVLEEGVRAGAHSIGLEYEGRDLMVFQNFGNTGLGAPRIPQELQQGVVAELVKRAGLSRKSKGKMQMSLLGKDFEVVSQAEAARNILEGFGTEKAMGYLIGEKFLHFLEVAETDRTWWQAIPAFVAEIKAIFEPWQLADFLNTPRRLGAVGHVADEEAHRMFREELEEEQRLREDARNLMLLEWAKELLLEE